MLPDKMQNWPNCHSFFFIHLVIYLLFPALNADMYLIRSAELVS